ncbi:TIR domain-containing protein [bacterium]|nr:TIR domain-containing protein [bacterium]
MAHDVFVSYSSKDKAIADTIVASMENNGIRCWYAPRDIKPGDDWGKAITEAIESCRVFLMIFSENANHSQRVLDELNYAVTKEAIILPFRIENLDPRGAMMLHLSSRHWLDAYDPSWESHIRKLVQTISTNLDMALLEEDVDVPEDIKKKEVRHKRKRLVRISIWVIVAAVVVIGVWLGLKYLPPEQKVEVTEDVQPIQSAGVTATQEVTATEGFAITESNESTGEELVTQTEESNLCKIVFYSERDGDAEVFVMKPDGSDQTQITFNQEIDTFAKFSPNGSKIAFMSMRDGDNEIFVMNSDGSNITKLTDNKKEDQRPRWSPDGKMIAFFSNRGGGYDLYIMNADGSDQKKITNQNFPNNSIFPKLSWSSDGSTIAFNSDMDGDSEIYLMNLDSSNIVQLTNNDSNDGQPDISPDMSKIVFESDRYGDTEIFVMDITGDNLHQLTSAKGVSLGPNFSPEGTKIIFVSDRDLTSGELDTKNFEIYVMNPDGSDIIRLTENEYPDGVAGYSPVCDF